MSGKNISQCTMLQTDPGMCPQPVAMTQFWMTLVMVISLKQLELSLSVKSEIKHISYKDFVYEEEDGDCFKESNKSLGSFCYILFCSMQQFGNLH